MKNYRQITVRLRRRVQCTLSVTRCSLFKRVGKYALLATQLTTLRSSSSVGTNFNVLHVTLLFSTTWKMKMNSVRCKKKKKLSLCAILMSVCIETGNAMAEFEKKTTNEFNRLACAFQSIISADNRYNRISGKYLRLIFSSAEHLAARLVSVPI